MEHPSCGCDKVLGFCLQANFHLEYDTAQCPHKHDLGMSVPNEFSFLPAGVLVVGVFRCRVLSSSLNTEFTIQACFWLEDCHPARLADRAMQECLTSCCTAAGTPLIGQHQCTGTRGMLQTIVTHHHLQNFCSESGLPASWQVHLHALPTSLCVQMPADEQMNSLV